MRSGIPSSLSRLVLVAAAMMVVVPVAARAADAKAPAAEALETVVISSRREVGGVIGDVAPDVRLNAAQIASYGAGSVAELLQALGPQIQSSRGDGPPVVLINGARVSGFAEVRDLPPEAIMRLDVFPEELSVKYGYRADQRVINFVLRPRFRAINAELGERVTTAGGRRSVDLDSNALRIMPTDRTQLAFKARHDEALIESEREVLGANGAVAPDAALRTLLPGTNQYSLNGVMTRGFDAGQSATVNASFDETRNVAGLGLVAGRPARRDDESKVARLGAIYNAAQHGWRWSLTGNAERTTSAAETSGESPGSARSRLQSAEATFVASGSPLDVPAGAATLTAKFALGNRDVESRSSRGTIVRATDLSRRSIDGQVSMDVPLAARASAVGALSTNFTLGLQDLADFGSLRSEQAGLTWSPTRQWRFIASVARDDVAPTMQQLGDPAIPTPGVRVFDFVRGETVIVTRIDGGDPNLGAGRRDVRKLGFSAQPFESMDFSVNANYVRTDARDLPTTLPIATVAAQTAFADRFVRDADGRLRSIDARPINLALRDRAELRWGFNLSLPWGPQPETPSFGRGERGERGDSGARGGGAGGGGGGGGAGRPNFTPEMRERMLGFARRGTVQFSLNHTLRLHDEARLASGLARLDLLNGASLSESFGQPQNEVEGQMALTRNGITARFTAQWREATGIRGNALRSDLRFGALTTVSVRVFADLGLQPFARSMPALRATRLSLQLNNLFDARPRVRAADGSTPTNFQADLLDPAGRSVRLNVRKLFF